MRVLLARLIKIENLSYEVRKFWPFLFWAFPGGVRGSVQIAHVIVISVYRSFDGWPAATGLRHQKLAPLLGLHQSGHALHWHFAVLVIAPMRCSLFLALGWGFALSLTFWLELSNSTH